MPRERDMRPTVDAWLEAQGLTAFHEGMWAHYYDVCGVRFAERAGRRIPPVLDVVAVELKLTDIAGVMRQGLRNLNYAKRSYAAMPRERCERMTPRTIERFAAACIGLLAVDGKEIAVRIPALGVGRINPHAIRTLWRRMCDPARPTNELTEIDKPRTRKKW